MPGFEQIEWFPLCAGLTALGFVATWFGWRRRGAASGLRLAAWSLLPLAAYLTGIITVLWKTGTAIATWAVNLVISPSMWAGVALAGLSVVAFVVSGAVRRRASRGSGKGQQKETSTGQSPQGHAAGSTQEIPAASKKAKSPAGAGSDTGGTKDGSGKDEDFSDVEEILRRHGIS